MAVIHGSRITQEPARIWFNGALMTVLASSGDTGRAFNLIEVVARAGHATPLHIDPSMETFHLLEGHLRFVIGDQELLASAGDTVIVPKGAAHAFLVSSPLVRYLLVTVPGGHDEFFRVAGVPAERPELPPPTPPDFARMTSAAARFGIEILGPPPFPRETP